MLRWNSLFDNLVGTRINIVFLFILDIIVEISVSSTGAKNFELSFLWKIPMTGCLFRNKNIAFKLVISILPNWYISKGNLTRKWLNILEVKSVNSLRHQWFTCYSESFFCHKEKFFQQYKYWSLNNICSQGPGEDTITIQHSVNIFPRN